MKLAVKEDVHFSVLETSLSDYIKQNSPELKNITSGRLDKIFKTKNQWGKSKGEPKFNKSSMFFHITLNGDIIGYFVCIPGMYKGSVWISEFYIEERYRNKGYGEASMKLIKDILKDKKYHCVALSFVNGNPAERLYIKSGFTNTICTDLLCEL